MRLRKAKINGFRSLKNVSLDFRSDFCVIIGVNDIGKSSVLQSLDIFLNDKKPDLQDFHFSLNKMEIELTFRADNDHEIDIIRRKLGDIVDENRDFSITKFYIKDGNRVKEEITTKNVKINSKLWKEELKGYFPKFIYVQSLRKIDDVAKVSSKSQFGQLLSLFYPDLLSEKQALEKKVESVLQDVKQDLETFLTEQTPNISGLEIETNMSLDKAFDVDFIIEDNFNNKTHISKRGSGVQSSLVVAIFRAYAKHKIENNIIFGIEEPEAYLHLGAQRKLCAALQEITESKGTQVIITTHSTVFIDRSHLNGLSLLKRDKNGQVIVKRIKKENDINEIRDALDIKNSDLLLWDAVLFVEGPTEKAVLDIWSKKLGYNFDKLGINIIPMDGCGNAQYFGNAKILEEFDIPYLILLDRDDNNYEIIEKLLNNNELNISRDNIHVLRKREIENYYSFRAVKESFPNINFSDLEINDDNNVKQTLETKTGQKAVYIGRKVAKEMTADEIDQEFKEIFARLEQMVKRAKETTFILTK